VASAHDAGQKHRESEQDKQAVSEEHTLCSHLRAQNRIEDVATLLDLIHFDRLGFGCRSDFREKKSPAHKAQRKEQQKQKKKKKKSSGVSRSKIAQASVAGALPAAAPLGAEAALDLSAAGAGAGAATDGAPLAAALGGILVYVKLMGWVHARDNQPDWADLGMDLGHLNAIFGVLVGFRQGCWPWRQSVVPRVVVEWWEVWMNDMTWIVGFAWLRC
jgi:hypothetical protein